MTTRYKQAEPELTLQYMVWYLLPGIFLFMLVLVNTSRAGNIPGLPAMQPPDLQSDIQLLFSNDFFSVITNLDDFRTQQISLTANVTDHWFLVFDQGILTTRGPNPELPDPPGQEGRLDQQSLSLGNRFWYQQTGSRTSQVLLGGGLRRYGNFAGARIQNGAHRLFKDEPVDLPYVSTERTDAVAWLRASHLSFPLQGNRDHGWRTGYWLDGTALLTTDGQSDGTLAAYGVLRHQDWELWTGPRADWRTGYNRDVVQKNVADHEHGLAWVAGIAYGPLRLETSEGLGDNDNSYGSLVLNAYAGQGMYSSVNGSHWAYQFGVLMPGFAMQNQFRWSPNKWRHEQGPAYSLVIDYRYGTESRNDAGTVYTISKQYLLGVEMKLADHRQSGWLQPYVMLGAGYRSEYLDGENNLAGRQSQSVGSAVLVTDAGVRFHMSGIRSEWQVQLLAGATGWLPLQERQVSFDGQVQDLLLPDAAWFTGVNVLFAY